MFIKPYSKILKKCESKDVDSYLGVVENNNDPDKKGKLQIRIDKYDDLPTDMLPWAEPLLPVFLGNSKNSVALSIPENGSQVRVYFPYKDDETPFYSGAEINDDNKCTFFDEDYPNTYGMKDSKGNFIKVNKSTGITTVQHSSTTNLQIQQNGSLSVTLAGGSSLNVDNSGSITLSQGSPSVVLTFNTDASGNLTLNCSNIDLTALSMALNIGTITTSGSLSVGAGASGVVQVGSQVLYITDGIITDIK